MSVVRYLLEKILMTSYQLPMIQIYRKHAVISLVGMFVTINTIGCQQVALIGWLARSDRRGLTQRGGGQAVQSELVRGAGRRESRRRTAWSSKL